jgi:hypothetical protein
MSHGIRVICPDCAEVVQHTCHNPIRKAVVDLLSWVPEGRSLATEKLNKAFMAAGRETGWIGDDETAEQRFSEPFFGSQSWSYPLLGSKAEARTFHALIHNLIRTVGMDPDAVIDEIYQARMRREEEAKARAVGAQKRRDARASLIAFLRGDAPLPERIAKLDEILRERAKGLKPYSDGKNDDGFGHLYKYLDNYYGGGISREINAARIKALESEAYDLAQEKKA